MFNALKRLVRKPSPAAWMVRRDGRKGTMRTRALIQREIGVGTSSTVHVVRADGTYRTQTTKDPLPVPNATFFAANCPDRAIVWQVEAASEIRRRCVPWCNLAVGPYLEARARHLGDQEVHLGGLASSDRDGKAWILMAADSTMNGFIGTMHHEVFHVAEASMDAKVIHMIDCSLAPDRQHYEGHAYLTDRMERRARLYQAFASMADEGMPVLVDESRRDAMGVFSAVYTGAFAQEFRD